jgi:hypothetical protein
MSKSVSPSGAISKAGIKLTIAVVIAVLLIGGLIFVKVVD